MCQTLERLFDQKLAGMPAEVRKERGGREGGRGSYMCYYFVFFYCVGG